MLSKNHAKWEKIKSEQDTSRAIGQIVDLVDESFGYREQEIEAICKSVSEINKALIGNGDPTNSIMARLKRIEDNYSEMNESVNAMKKLLIGDLDSRKNSVADALDNMNERIERLERSMLNINKVVWIVATALIGEIVLAIIRLL